MVYLYKLYIYIYIVCVYVKYIYKSYTSPQKSISYKVIFHKSIKANITQPPQKKTRAVPCYHDWIILITPQLGSFLKLRISWTHGKHIPGTDPMGLKRYVYLT